MKSEMFLQIQFAKWLDSKGILYCASAGGMRVNMVTAVNMKRSGYKKGFPDIFIYEPCRVYKGLAIELKAGAGKASPEQKVWQQELQKRGYCAVIMPGNLEFSEALEWLKNYVIDYLEL